MVKVKANITELRNVATSLGGTTDNIENQYNKLHPKGSSLKLSTSSLIGIPGYVESLREECKYLSAKADWLEIINTGDDGKIPTGDVSCDIPGNEPKTLSNMEHWLGEAMADSAKKLATADYKEDDPRLKSLRDKMARWKGDAVVMSPMFSDLGPEGTLVLTHAVGAHSDLTRDTTEEERKASRELLVSIKEGLATATNSWPAAQSQKFGQDLVKFARHPDQNSDYYLLDVPIPRVEALNWLLYKNKASNEFNLGAAEKMDEIQQEDNKNGVDGWRQMGPSYFLPLMVDGADKVWAFDTPTSVFRALGEHPQASYQFFNGNVRRMTYWSAQHDYASGNLSGIAAAFDAASTDPAIMRKDPGGAATIASYGVNGIMGRSDVGPKTQYVPTVGDMYLGMQGTETAGSVRHIFQTYFSSVADGFANSSKRPTADLDHDGVPDQTYAVTQPTGQAVANSPWFSRESLNKAFGIIGRDPQSMLKMRETLSNAETQRVNPGMDEKESEAMMTYWANVEGAVANAIGTAAINDAELKDKNAKAWIQLGSMGASEVASKVPGGKVASIGSDAFIDWLAKQAEDNWAKNASTEKEKQEALTDQALQDYKRRLLFAYDQAGLNGYQNDIDPDTGKSKHPLSASHGDAVVEEPVGSGNYRLITKKEYDALPADRQSTVRNTLNSLAGTSVGWGDILAGELVESTFETGFEDRF